MLLFPLELKRQLSLVVLSSFAAQPTSRAPRTRPPAGLEIPALLSFPPFFDFPQKIIITMFKNNFLARVQSPSTPASPPPVPTNRDWTVCS